MKNLIKFKIEKTEEDLKIESMKAPPILELTNEEKFIDTNGQILDIEIRGTRNIDNIFFKVKDVGALFKLGDVKTILLNKDSSFTSILHYKLFKSIRINNPDSNKNKKGNQYVLFLTFKGLIKLLYVSQSKNAEHFQDWSNKLLFTHKLGTIEEKKQLSSELLGIPYNDMKRFINIHINEIPCVYLISLGTVTNLRESMNISNEFTDESIIFKFGFTKNFKERWSMHKTEYNKIKGINLYLKNISIIDAEYVSNAEKDIKNSLHKYSFNYDKHEELLIIPNKDIKYVENINSLINYKYCKYNEELNKQLNVLRDEIKEKENIIIQKTMENEKQQIVIELEKEKENIIIQKTMENEKQQIVIELEKERSSKKDVEIELLKQQLYIKELESKIKN